MAGSIIPPESGGSLGTTGDPWTDAVLSGSLTDAAGNAKTPKEIHDHIDSTSNPHNVTYTQVGADAAGSAASVAGDLSNHIIDSVGAHAAPAISYNNATSQLVATEVKSAIDEIVMVPKFSAGCVSVPSYTDNGSGSITVNAVNAYFYKTTDYSGGLYKYTLAQQNLNLTDNTTNYIVGKYNGGSPVIAVTTAVADINESDVIPILTIYRNGTYLHTVNWDSLGLGMISKLHYSIVKTQRYRRESGLALSVDGSRVATVASGIVWIAANSVSLDEVVSNVDTMLLSYRSGGSWTTTAITTLNNTQYDNGTTLATLTANRYAVNFIYRGVETQKHLYVTLGAGDYTLDDAQKAQPLAPPALISSHAVLVGKVIYQKSSSTAYSVQSAFDVSFVTAGVTNHGDLDGLTETAVHPAASISVDASGFDGNLDDSVVNVQLLAEAVDNLATGGYSLWTDVASVTRTDSNTLAKSGLESVLPVGTHVRSYSGTTRPVTTSTDWKHHYVISVGTDAVDVIGEEIPTGGTTLFVEYSNDIASTMAMPTRKLSGYWAAATGTSLIVNAVFSGNTLEWGEKAGRLIGAFQVRSGTDDTGATQPTIMITSGGTDLLGGALSVSESEANTGIIASGQAVSANEIIDVDCESTGTNADSYNLRMRFLIARHI